jgi:membrane fusion protein
MERLLVDDVVSQIEVDQARTDDINQALALASIDQQIVARRGTLTDTSHALMALEPAKDREQSQLRQQIAQLEESRTALQATSSYAVRSPVSGQITALQGNVGQSLQPSAPIVVIMPDNAELMAILLAPTRSAGFLKPGQDVNLLVDAFPYQKFGIQSGRVSEISETPYRPGELDAPVAFDQPVYQIKVALNKATVAAYGEEVPLKPGMTLQGDIVTDRRSLVEWMLDPLFSLRRS